MEKANCLSWNSFVSNTIMIFSLIGILVGCSDVPEENLYQPTPIQVEEQNLTPLSLGATFPDFELPGPKGKFYTHKYFSHAPQTLIVFLSAICPSTPGVLENLVRMDDEYEDLAIMVVLPSSPLALAPEQLGPTDLDNTYRSVTLLTQRYDITFPVLYDGDQHQLSLSFGPPQLPYAYVFDQQQLLTHRGLLGAELFKSIAYFIDLDWQDQDIPTHCSVNWAWNNTTRRQLDSIWYNRGVEFEPIDLDALDSVLHQPSDRIRLVSFWATWCGPCKKEFPDLLMLQRQYGQYGLDLITISVDDPERFEAAKTFLDQIHAPVRNFHLTEQNPQDIVQKVHPDWDETLPFSLLILPNGTTEAFWSGPLELEFVKDRITDLLH